MSDEMPAEERKYMAFAAQVQQGKVEFDGDFPAPGAWKRFEQDYVKEAAMVRKVEGTKMANEKPDVRREAAAYREKLITAGTAAGDAPAETLRPREEDGQAARARVR